MVASLRHHEHCFFLLLFFVHTHRERRHPFAGMNCVSLLWVSASLCRHEHRTGSCGVPLPPRTLAPNTTPPRTGRFNGYSEGGEEEVEEEGRGRKKKNKNEMTRKEGGNNPNRIGKVGVSTKDCRRGGGGRRRIVQWLVFISIVIIQFDLLFSIVAVFVWSFHFFFAVRMTTRRWWWRCWWWWRQWWRSNGGAN